jgi:hypothetical protein
LDFITDTGLPYLVDGALESTSLVASGIVRSDENGLPYMVGVSGATGWLHRDAVTDTYAWSTPTASDVGALPVDGTAVDSDKLDGQHGSYYAVAGAAPAAHQLDGALHTVSGLTAGHFLKALTPTTFGFAAHGLTASDVGAEVPLTFSTGLTRSTNTITADISTGKAGGQTIYGGTLTTQGLTIQPNVADATTGSVTINASTACTGSGTGSLINLGGLSNAGVGFFGKDVYASQTNAASSLGTEMISAQKNRDFSTAPDWAGVPWVQYQIYSEAEVIVNATNKTIQFTDVTYADCGITVGMILVFGGFLNSGNNGTFTITSFDDDYTAVFAGATGMVDEDNTEGSGIYGNVYGASGWALNAATWKYTPAGAADGTTLANTYLSESPVAGTTYYLAFTVSTSVAGTLTPSFGGASLPQVGQSAGTTSYGFYITAANTNALIFTPSVAWAGYIDNISIKKVTNYSAAYSFYNSSGSLIGEIRGNSYSVGLGYHVFHANVPNYATAMGYEAMGYATSGSSYNTAFGYRSLQIVSSGGQNTAIGAQSLSVNLTSSSNTAIGYKTLGALRSGSGSNTALGYQAGYTAATSTGNVFIGSNAGYHETGDSKLFIDNATRSSEADARTKALIYGIFASAVANQYLTVNGALTVSSTTASTTTATGSGIFSGGVGIAGAANIGADSSITGTTTSGTLGSELITDQKNREFTSAPDWTTGSGTWSLVSATWQHAAGANATSLASTSGSAYSSYVLVFTVVTTTAGVLTPSLGANNGIALTLPVGTVTAYTQIISCGAAGGAITFTPDASWAGSIDNISLKQITTTTAALTLKNSDGTTGFVLRAGGSGRNNTFVGNGPGFYNTTGGSNVGIGYLALYRVTTGATNLAMGSQALVRLTTGSNNVAIGSNALGYITTATQNIGIGVNALSASHASNNSAIGYNSMVNNLWGTLNVAIGVSSLASNTNGDNNTAIGCSALYSQTTGTGNVGIGYQAGYYETGSSKLFIDNAKRASEADARTKALIYGIFDAAVANQYLYVNGSLVALGLYNGAHPQIAASHIWTTSGGRLYQKESAPASDTDGWDLRACGKFGVATMAAGTVTVSDTNITATSKIVVTAQDGTTNVGHVSVTGRSVGASFTIGSSNVLDTRNVVWAILEY